MCLYADDAVVWFYREASLQRRLQRVPRNKAELTAPPTTCHRRSSRWGQIAPHIKPSVFYKSVCTTSRRKAEGGRWRSLCRGVLQEPGRLKLTEFLTQYSSGPRLSLRSDLWSKRQTTRQPFPPDSLLLTLSFRMNPLRLSATRFRLRGQRLQSARKLFCRMNGCTTFQRVESLSKG